MRMTVRVCVLECENVSVRAGRWEEDGGEGGYAPARAGTSLRETSNSCIRDNPITIHMSLPPITIHMPLPLISQPCVPHPFSCSYTHTNDSMRLGAHELLLTKCRDGNK